MVHDMRLQSDFFTSNQNRIVIGSKLHQIDLVNFCNYHVYIHIAIASRVAACCDMT